MTASGARSSSLAVAGRATLVLTGGTLIVQVVGFVRQLFLASEVGIASGLDAFLIGLAAPQAIMSVLTAGVIIAIIPAYAAAKGDRSAAAAKRLAGTVLVWMGIAGLAVSLVLWVLAEPVVAITGPGLAEGGTTDEAVRFLRILAPLAFFGAVSSIFFAVCQAEFLFLALAVAIVADPLFALAFTVWFWETLGLDGLAIGTLIGSCMSVIILAVATMVRRVAPSPGVMPRGLGLRSLVRHAAPLSLSAGILQVNDMVTRAVASLLLAGGVSAIRYGDSLVRAPFGALNPAYGRAIYPTLVQASRETDQTALGNMTGRLLRYALVFFVPIAGLTIAVAPLATAIAYDRGAFGDDDLALTAQVVAVSSPLIVTWTVMPTLISALNAKRRGLVLLAAGVVNASVNLALTLVLGLLLGVAGVALATALASIVAIVFMGHRLTRLEPSFRPRPVWRTLLTASLATLPSAVLFGVPIWAGIVGGDLVQRVIFLVVVGVAGLTAYYGIARRLGLEEAGAIIAFGKATVRRAARAVTAPLRSP